MLKHYLTGACHTFQRLTGSHAIAHFPVCRPERVAWLDNAIESTQNARRFGTSGRGYVVRALGGRYAASASNGSCVTVPPSSVSIETLPDSVMYSTVALSSI